ncbi:hypothetical protein IMG5_152770 [Ichthyophthirius multifiliis]|uniref:Cyclic nucleotide-binding domain-containing protein n=1 Tax=Ichthyophthirius multifiliis TaxID=5932 RepID=G0QYW4_ICHMU|nr:hypothetical protein IMG5_152770 [Ichthyophthirius multifiliis]EGR29593.1 hypothetical protein IMG5_152770 [Ichthyophthirius multifiliis]|eukprot:XP_004030829.1 hypothetical protein IMG5_152770 [Ichthyophthirius multifiliis]
MQQNKKQKKIKIYKVSDLLYILSKEPHQRLPQEIQTLQNCTEHIKFFKDLTQADKGKSDVHCLCCQYMTYESYKKGQEVIKIGSIGDKFYIILNGQVSIHIKKYQDYDQEIQIQGNQNQLINVGILQSGQSFGELALLSNKPRLATIICESDCDFFILEKRTLIKFQKTNKKYQIKNQIFYKTYPFWLIQANKILEIFILGLFINLSLKNKLFFQKETFLNVCILQLGEFLLQKKIQYFIQKKLGNQKVLQQLNRYKRNEQKKISQLRFNRIQYK